MLSGLAGPWPSVESDDWSCQAALADGAVVCLGTSSLPLEEQQFVWTPEEASLTPPCWNWSSYLAVSVLSYLVLLVSMSVSYAGCWTLVQT